MPGSGSQRAPRHSGVPVTTVAARTGQGRPKAAHVRVRPGAGVVCPAREADDVDMTQDVGRRARERAAEAHQRALEAGARAAELAGGVSSQDPETAVARSQAALERAAQLAKEGYLHAADAERAAARAHEGMATTLELRADRDGDESDALRARAAKHREDANDHLRKAALDDARLAEITERSGGRTADGTSEHGSGRRSTGS